MLFQTVLVATLVALACGAPQPTKIAPRLDGRIVGGESVDIEQYPYQLSLLYYGSHICGASIVGWNVAITAAHCTDGSATSALSIRAGSSIRNSGGRIYTIQYIYQHPDYNSNTIDHDISVIILREEISFGPGVNTIRLPAPHTPITPGSPAVCSGWGTLTEGGSLPSQLQAVTVNIVSSEACGAAYGPAAITERMVCAGVDGGGKDACQGDSGGPLVVGGELIGVVSWGYGCARPDYPGVYSSVVALREYITEVANL